MDLTTNLQIGKDAFDRGDYQEAFSRLLPCAEAGIAEAEAAVGTLYMLGLGIERNARKAVVFLTRAADKGSANAAHNLSTLYVSGDPDIPLDVEESKRWYRRARKLGFIVRDGDHWYRELDNEK